VTDIFNSNGNIRKFYLKKKRNNNNNNNVLPADESILGYTWRRVTIALVDMISSATPANPREELDGAAHRRRRLHRQAASVVLTAILVAVVVALSCGICGVVTVLYRRRRCDRRAGQGLGCDDDDCDDDDGGAGDGTEKTTVVVGQQHAAGVMRSAAGVARERQPPAGTCRRTDYKDTPNGRNADALRPLLQVQQQRHRRPAQRQPIDETGGPAKDAVPSAARTADAAVVNAKDRRGGPDVVMSTATTLPDTDGTYIYIRSLFYRIL